MLRMIVDKNLVRFSSIVQAIDDWFDLQWGATNTKMVSNIVALAAEFLTDPSARKTAFLSDEPERIYCALWASGCEDVADTVQAATKLLKHTQVEVRYVAARILRRISLAGAAQARLLALQDEDLRVALTALQTSDDDQWDEGPAPSESLGAEWFEQLEQLFERMPSKATKLKPLVWPWTEQTARRDQVGEQLLAALGDLPPTRLIPYLKSFDTYDRAKVIGKLAAQKKWNALTRSTILETVGDTSTDVHSNAIKALLKRKLKPDDGTAVRSLFETQGG